MLFLIAVSTAAPPASDPAAWTAEEREQVEDILEHAGAKAHRSKLHEQDAQRAKGVPVALMVGQPTYPRYQLEHDTYGCVIVSFDILASGKTDQFEVVKGDPPGVFDMLAMRMMLHTTFEKPAKGVAPLRHRKAVFVLLPQSQPREFSRLNEHNETERTKRRAELRAACEAQAP